MANKRSRAACEGCKKGKKKCDERKPVCLRCEKRGAACEYKTKIQFRDDLESRGQSFGRAGAWKDAPEYSELVSRAHFVPVQTKLYFVSNETTTEYSYSQSDLAYEEVVHMCTKSYRNYLSAMLAPVQSSSVPVKKSIDVDMLIDFSKPSLLLAMGAFRLFKRERHHIWLHWSTRFRETAENELRDFMEVPEHMNASLELLLSLMLLMILEIANDSPKWTHFLRLSRKILNRGKFPIANSAERRILTFIIEFLIYQESMGRTACQDVSLFVEYTELLGPTNNDARTIVPWMGCSTALVSVISDITDLSFERNKYDGASSKMFAGLCLLIEENLEALRVELPQSGEELCLLMTCEVKRLAAHVFLKGSLLNKTPRDVAGLVEKAFGYMEYIVMDQEKLWGSCLLWPLFVCGVEIDPVSEKCETLRRLCLDLLERIHLHTWGSAESTTRIITSVWNKRDTLYCIGLNDWEFFVADTNFQISLA